jgi:hypothetical protein
MSTVGYRYHGNRDPNSEEANLPTRSKAAAREVRLNTPHRQARTCYGHLAGVHGVILVEELIQRGWVIPSTGRQFELTEEGAVALARRGVQLPHRTRRRGPVLARGCLDWTERRYHLGGSLGLGITRVLLNQSVIRKMPDSRVLTFVTSLKEWLETGDN